MTRPGTPTAETWNKQVIPAACWGRVTAAPATADNPAKISRTKLDLAPAARLSCGGSKFSKQPYSGAPKPLQILDVRLISKQLPFRCKNFQ
ncbi:hypothetical protein [Microcoleus sp. Pol12A6]|uniref:hypothetical protein n=1 Tax=Microcoleus sp. Pol12A6 TaxID=3055393 RepID=UPI002FD65899